MKISEMNTSQFSEKICELIEPISNIMEDKEFVLAIQRLMQGRKENEVLPTVVRFAKKLVPLMLAKHQDDTFEIVAILNEKTVEEVKKQSIKQTIDDIKNSIDEDLIELFK